MHVNGSSNYDNNIVFLLLHLVSFNVRPGNLFRMFAPKVWRPCRSRVTCRNCPINNFVDRITNTCGVAKARC